MSVADILSLMGRVITFQVGTFFKLAHFVWGKKLACLASGTLVRIKIGFKTSEERRLPTCLPTCLLTCLPTYLPTGGK